MKKCNSCGEINKDDAKFCIKCGKQLSNFTLLCPNCKSIITPDDVFCTICGKRIVVSDSKQTEAKKETYKYIEKPVIEAGRNRNFKIFLGLIGGFAAVAVIAVILIFVLDIGNLTTPFKSITEVEEHKEDGLEETAKEQETDKQITELPKEVPTDDKLAPVVDSITPDSGTLGTIIQIKGSNLGNSDLKSVSLGEHELNISAVSDDMIEVNISYGAQSGKIVLTFAEEKIDAGAFKVLPQQKQLLLENEIKSSTESQTVSVDNIAVTIPGNAIDKTQTIKIEQIADPQPINLPQSAQLTSFSVAIGDMHQFNDIITIEYTIPSDAQGEPSAVYFDEATSLWDTLPSEVIDGKLCIYTNHLTDFGIFYWGKSIYSSEGFFKIYYHADDVTKFAGSMDELAIKVGDALEKIKKDYEKKIPAGYREDFSFMGFTDSMDVYIDSEKYFAAKYNALTNNLLLPTKYTSIDDFETVLAHEFFHSYQDSVWNEISYIGKMGKSENIWAVEALAELAAYELAYPEKKRERLITDGVSSQDPHYTFDEIHEYSMSCFLRYLLRNTNSKFEELWIYVASSGTSKIEYSINEFFRSKSTDFISLGNSYTKFWRDILGNADAPKQLALNSLIEIKNLKASEHSAIFKYQTSNIETTAFNMLKVIEFSENMPVRIFNMEFIDGSNSGVWSTQISGVKNINAITDLRISGGRNWNYSSTASDSSSGSYERYVFKKGSDDIVLIALDCLLKNELSGVKISEIQAQCKPAKIEDASVGKEYEFELAFKDIFTNVTNVVIEVDFGDGEVVEYQKKNENGMLSSIVKHLFSKPGNIPVKCSLYDVSQQDKVLISQLYIPVAVNLELTLSANPNPVTLGEAVSLSTNITNKDYRYKWDLGDGTKLDKVGLYKTEHIYSHEGDYPISVEIYDGKGELVGKAETTVMVKLELMLSANPNPVTLGETLSLSTNITNKDYTYKWDLGDGTKLGKVGLYKTEHIYSLEGDYPISVEIYDGKGELVGKATQNVTVALPEVTETTPSNSEIVGTWIVQSDTYFYYYDYSVSYVIVTFVLNGDGTCSYEYLPVVLREPSEEIDPQERIDLAAMYKVLNPSYHPPEYESGKGTYTYLGKGQYFEENKVGIATMLYTSASGQYERSDSIYLRDDELIFSSTVFTKK